MTKDDLISKVRIFLRDHDNLRVLLEDQESTDDDIGLAIDMALSDLNATPPITSGWTWDDYPLAIIIFATVAEVLFSVGIASTANTLPYQDGNVGNIDTESKAQPFMTIGQYYLDYAIRRAAAYKASVDTDSILGGSISDDGTSDVGIPSGQF